MKKNVQTKASKYKLLDNFGVKQNQKINDNDIITKVKFDKQGKYIAVSDKAGRIIIFAEQNSNKLSYDYQAQFQSFQMEFDALNSQNIEPQIVSLEWMNKQSKYNKIIVSNYKKIKIWKFYENQKKTIIRKSGQKLNIPKIESQKNTQLVVNQFLYFPDLHKYEIHTISSTKNEEYLLSGDKLQCFLWNYQKNRKPYVVLDLLKNNTIQQVCEDITICKTHPINDNIFIYGTNRGNLKQIDLRQSSPNNPSSLSFQDQTGNNSKLNKFLNIYSDVKYLKNGKYIIARDYLAVKIWDICNPKVPLRTFTIQDDIKKTAKQVIQNQYYHDNFQIAVLQQKESNLFYTGQYNNSFHLCDIENKLNFRYQFSSIKQTKMTEYKGSISGKTNFNKLSKSGDFHPDKDILAVSMLNGLYIYGIK